MIAIIDHTTSMLKYSNLSKYADKFTYKYEDCFLPTTQSYQYLKYNKDTTDISSIIQIYTETLEREMEKVLEISNYGVVVFSPANKFSYANKKANELYMFEYPDFYGFESNFSVVGLNNDY